VLGDPCCRAELFKLIYVLFTSGCFLRKLGTAQCLQVKLLQFLNVAFKLAHKFGEMANCESFNFDRYRSDLNLFSCCFVD